jgi:signal peptidase
MLKMNNDIMKINAGNNLEQTGNEYLLIVFFINLCLLGDNLLIKVLPASFKFIKYISPACFILITICIVFFLPAIHTLGKNRIRNIIIGFSIAGSVVYIAINYGAGLFLKNIALSPYDISPKGVIGNIAVQIPEIIAFIMVRSYSVNAVYKKTVHPVFWIAVISLYLAALQFNFTKLSIVRSLEDLFICIAQDIMPKITLSFLMTILCLAGGSIPCIYYMCINKIFMFLFPFLPSLPWVAESVIGIAYPIILSMLIWEEYKILSHLKPSSQKENIFSFSASLIFLVVFSWFIVGVFPIYPSVILTGSMEPLIYPGDIVMIKKIKTEEEVYKLKEGDIINFKMGNITITHRIAKIESDEAGNLSFITKGDNNDAQDPWVVPPNDLKGTIEKVVPKIGLPVLMIHKNDNIPEGVSNY